eukprot:CAMPEP_0119006324 /NCGR_PEP_ID=MMETSP1176-20130426/2232_1 /TAXON_ID=265551 /ORGANISM="Synedropsis recta cf, Strain CCMP1620" /LENGTH=345 /DNA_ID=CAMNT_0006958229 /DNA_START=99 /DNA_END=1133 /DNA_ORIENTATION=-
MMLFRFLLGFVLMQLSTLNVCFATNERLFVSVNGPLVNARLDPLVNPNTCSGHVHSVFGSASFGSSIRKGDVTDDDWEDDTGKVNQTTSNVVPNLSMYWAPSLYIFNPVDDLYYIVPTFSRAYYRIRHPNDRSVINPFPRFLRLLAGNAARTTDWDATDPTEEGHDDISWNYRNNRQLTNYQEHGDWAYLREKTLDEIGSKLQVEMNINFPNCLELKSNGQPRTRSGNFRNHASYSNPDATTTCPVDFPYRIPTLNLEVRYNLKAMRAILDDDVVNNVTNWRLSTGDASGAGAHADFVSGWPEELFQDMLDNCDDGKALNSSVVCPIEQYMNQTRDEMNTKTVPW